VNFFDEWRLPMPFEPRIPERTFVWAGAILGGMFGGAVLMLLVIVSSGGCFAR
jgi:hypothetical protein